MQTRTETVTLQSPRTYTGAKVLRLVLARRHVSCFALFENDLERHSLKHDFFVLLAFFLVQLKAFWVIRNIVIIELFLCRCEKIAIPSVFTEVIAQIFLLYKSFSHSGSLKSDWSLYSSS